MFINVQGKEESTKSHSIYNIDEVNVTYRVVEEFRRNGKNAKGTTIMTGYRAQSAEIRKRCKNDYPCKVTTIDAIQGLESDVILVSLVRADSKSIGFLADKGRQCVLLSRAKTCMILVGNLDVFAKANQSWKHIGDYLYDNGFVYEANNVGLKELKKRMKSW